ncbi:MAG TPA: glycosyltransferase [Methylophilaceae bacterium]|nr:glycosyltransferase [Methylophilaceae bacterium]
MLVSIYTPTKNRKDALERAVNSVLNQTYNNIELIVVNDGSTDSTADFLKKKSQQDNRLKYINNNYSRGAPASRNIAIKNSGGQFVTGLDDDDEFLPERIEAFVKYWQLLDKLGYSPSCLYSQDIVTRNGERIFNSHKKGMIEASDLFEFNFIGNQVFAPKSHYLGAGLFDEELPAWQDLEMFMRILKNFGTAHLLDCATQIYDDTPRDDRISVNGESKIREAYLKIANRHASKSPRDAQKLFFQVFSKYYGLHPSFKDWIQFIKLGLWPKGLIKLALKTFRV